MDAITTALVGFGISGQCFQAPILQNSKEIDLVAVVSSDSDKVLQQLPNVSVFASLESLLENDTAELIIIATPNHLHFPLCKLALEAGRHVVVEKPFVIDSKEGQQLINLSEKYDKKLSVYQSRRFDGDFLTIKKVFNEGTLGKIHTFYSSYNRYRPLVKVRWREQDIPGAGILYDLGAHLIDQALDLFGKPLSITATLRKQRQNAQTVDHFHLLLTYDQCDVILHSNCLSTAEGARFQIFGDKGSFIKQGMDPQEEFLREKQGPLSCNWGKDCIDNYAVITDHEGVTTSITTEQGGYEKFYQQLALAIRNNAPLPVSAEQALDVIKVIEAAYLSQQQQRTIFF